MIHTNNTQQVHTVSYPTNQQPQQPQQVKEPQLNAASPAYINFSPANNGALFSSEDNGDNDAPPKPAIPNSVY